MPISSSLDLIAALHFAPPISHMICRRYDWLQPAFTCFSPTSSSLSARPLSHPPLQAPTIHDTFTNPTNSRHVLRFVCCLPVAPVWDQSPGSSIVKANLNTHIQQLHHDPKSHEV
uniref:Uncharacterized protein n=1 Tax=Bionectria ochroleuca TaxID=29856 RepID=A0A8H7N851_BIOOC